MSPEIVHILRPPSDIFTAKIHATNTLYFNLIKSSIFHAICVPRDGNIKESKGVPSKKENNFELIFFLNLIVYTK